MTAFVHSVESSLSSTLRTSRSSRCSTSSNLFNGIAGKGLSFNRPTTPSRSSANTSIMVLAQSNTQQLGSTTSERPLDVQPTIINKNSARFAAIAVAIAAAARGTEFLPVKVAGFLHLISFAANFGMLFWVTFVAGLVMFKNLTRQTFGKLQTKLFPKYFLISIACLALQIGTLQFALPAGLQKQQATSLGIALAAAIVNYVVEPMGTRILLERYALENAEGPKDKETIKSLKSKFGAFHAFSSLVNLVLLVAVASHGYWLSTRVSFA